MVGFLYVQLVNNMCYNYNTFHLTHMNLYYIANARMPTEKAHGIQIAKMCEAFIEEGVDVTLVVPRRRTEPLSVQEFYGLRCPVKVVMIPAIDWYTGGRFGYLISSLSFVFSYLAFIVWKKIRGEKFILYTVDTDNYSSSALAVFGGPIFSEMHGSKPASLAQKILFSRAKGIIAINKIIVDELRYNFPSSKTGYLVEPNGVDLSKFSFSGSKKEAREKLGLPANDRIVLYAGRFFAWKGLEILPKAAVLSPEVRWQTVGGDEDNFKKLTGATIPSNLFFAGDRPHGEMSLWFAAADALLVLGTVRDVQSYRYTSPMKLFEYMAARRPIIASNTPAIREIVNESQVIFYEPDDSEGLARAVRYALSGSEKLGPMIEASAKRATTSSWRSRAQRIIAFIEESARL